MEARKETRVGLKDGHILTVGLFRLRVIGGPVSIVVSHASGDKVHRDEFAPGMWDLTTNPPQCLMSGE